MATEVGLKWTGSKALYEDDHSHSIVAGGLELMSSTTRLTPRTSFVMRLETPIPPTGETPREVDGLLESLRDKSLLKREFPVIELKDLRAMKPQTKGSEAVASYSIVCLPPAPKSGPAKKE